MAQRARRLLAGDARPRSADRRRPHPHVSERCHELPRRAQAGPRTAAEEGPPQAPNHPARRGATPRSRSMNNPRHRLCPRAEDLAFDPELAPLALLEAALAIAVQA